MKTVLVSDIHGVDEALRQILTHHTDDMVICLGDAVGNRPNDETLRLLKEREVPCVKGNHEVDLIGFYKVAKHWLGWIYNWPHSIVDGDSFYCHTWLDKRNRFLDIDSSLSAKHMFRSRDFRVAFVGHSHSPGWWCQTSEEERPVWTHAQPGTELELGRGRYIVDVGSVGEPKLSEDARYATWDGHTVTWNALP